MKHRLRTLKWGLMDFKSRLARNWASNHQGMEKHGLLPHQVYPKGRNLDFDFIAQPKERFPRVISPETRVASIGSCFAVELKRYFQDHRFNFVSTEESWAGSAEWGRVYTTKNLLQIFQYSLGEFFPEVSLARTEKGVFDPYREGGFYETEQAAQEGIARHRQKSREALTSCEVLVVTPGQNEAWVNRSDGLAWAHPPPPELAGSDNDHFFIKRFSLEENIAYLDCALKLLRENNPKVKVILTVSPVPSWATFFDLNVVTRSFENKAILLLAVREVVNQNPDWAYYFPSFEMALLSNNPNLMLDNRHVRPRMVEEIMGTFSQCFLSRP